MKRGKMEINLLVGDVLQRNRAGITEYSKQILKGFCEDAYLVSEHEIKNPFPVPHLWYPYVARKMRKWDLGSNGNIFINNGKMEVLDAGIIHNPTQFPTLFKMPAPYVLTVHDLVPILYPQYHRYPLRYWYALTFKKTLRSADRIICISKNTEKDLLKLYPECEGKTRVVYNGYDPYFKDLKMEREDFILSVGTIEPRKNYVRLVKAWDLIPRSVKGKTRLLIAGAIGWESKRNIEWIRDHNDIDLLGRVSKEELRDLYNTAKFFVYPSLYEGFGLPPLEAMACGCPTITSETSSLKEVVGAGSTIDPYNINFMSEDIYLMLTRPKLRDSLVKLGEWNITRFSWEKCIKETKQVYEELI
jgi:glycosyltransferase involved in cell wall biosynthesis